MDEKVFNHGLLSYLEGKVVENGTMHIDSVFRFEKNPEDLPAFLWIAKEKNCTIVFENEGYTFKPAVRKRHGRCHSSFWADDLHEYGENIVWKAGKLSDEPADK